MLILSRRIGGSRNDRGAQLGCLRAHLFRLLLTPGQAGLGKGQVEGDPVAVALSMPKVVTTLAAERYTPELVEAITTAAADAGRNLAVLVEAAVRNTVLQLRGIDTYREFIERHQRAMERGGGH